MLFKELLIGVTNFFRNAEAFEILERKILPKIISGKPENYELRVWIPGCSTGEEVYSIAMVIREYMDELKHNFKVQIFGTDIDEEAIARARSGLYPGNIGLDVNPQRLKRFFIKEENEYRIKKGDQGGCRLCDSECDQGPAFYAARPHQLPEPHDLSGAGAAKQTHPPFPLQPEARAAFFSSGLRKASAAFPTFSHHRQEMEILQEEGIQSKVDAFTFPALSGAYGTDKTRKAGGREAEPAGVPALAQRVLLANFAPPAVIVNMKGDIIYIHGQTGKYLELSPGQPTVNVLEMARKDCAWNCVLRCIRL